MLPIRLQRSSANVSRAGTRSSLSMGITVNTRVCLLLCSHVYTFTYAHLCVLAPCWFIKMRWHYILPGRRQMSWYDSGHPDSPDLLWGEIEHWGTQVKEWASLGGSASRGGPPFLPCLPAVDLDQGPTLSTAPPDPFLQQLPKLTTV